MSANVVPAPMLAVRWDSAFNDPAWYFEPKWDGYRTIVKTDGKDHRIWSRTGVDLTDRFDHFPNPTSRGAVLDGELVALDENGVPSFSLLQRRAGFRRPQEVGVAPLAVMVFDLLELDGQDLRGLALEERQQQLNSLELSSPWHVTDGLAEFGTELWATVVEMNLEGIVAKRLSSKYHSGKRSPDWRKVAVRKTVRCVVGGFTRGEGTRSSSFGSLILGMMDEDSLIYVGSVGTGFDAMSLTAIREALDEMTVPDSPFALSEAIPGEPVWVAPMLVARVEFREWTTDHRLRHPTFKGFGSEEPNDVRLVQEQH